jgi:2,4-dienoyl-CoA reductase-like NADH-dependent reductase (Old Yellow Enzyme family)
MTQLFSPLQLGPYTLNHRVVHAPTTRLRANRDDRPSDMMLKYYMQRASAGGLIITESTHVSYDSRGYFGAPGICEDSHIPGWRKIADAVHAKGGRIFMQLGHDGRQSRSLGVLGRHTCRPYGLPRLSRGGKETRRLIAERVYTISAVRRRKLAAACRPGNRSPSPNSLFLKVPSP